MTDHTEMSSLKSGPCRRTNGIFLC